MFIVKQIALLNSWLSYMADSYAKARLKMFLLLNFYANFNSTEPYLFTSVSAGGELFFLFQLYIFLKLIYQHIYQH